jgi:cytochrome c553
MTIVSGGAMKKIILKFTGLTVLVLTAVLLAGCALTNRSNTTEGTSWGEGVFTSNGEQIYFTATSDSGTDITYAGGPSSNNWMMMNGVLACASCHGPDGRGGVHSMAMMEQMDAPDIRWSALENEFDTEKFQLAVEQGDDPDGSKLSTDMPRWKMDDGDVADLMSFLKTLP